VSWHVVHVPCNTGTLRSLLTNLAGVHTERGELSEALAAAREGLPLRRAPSSKRYGGVAYRRSLRCR